MPYKKRIIDPTDELWTGADEERWGNAVLNLSTPIFPQSDSGSDTTKTNIAWRRFKQTWDKQYQSQFQDKIQSALVKFKAGDITLEQKDSYIAQAIDAWRTTVNDLMQGNQDKFKDLDFSILEAKQADDLEKGTTNVESFFGGVEKQWTGQEKISIDVGSLPGDRGYQGILSEIRDRQAGSVTDAEGNIYYNPSTDQSVVSVFGENGWEEKRVSELQNGNYRPTNYNGSAVYLQNFVNPIHGVDLEGLNTQVSLKDQVDLYQKRVDQKKKDIDKSGLSQEEKDTEKTNLEDQYSHSFGVYVPDKYGNAVKTYLVKDTKAFAGVDSLSADKWHWDIAGEKVTGEMSRDEALQSFPDQGVFAQLNDDVFVAASMGVQKSQFDGLTEDEKKSARKNYMYSAPGLVDGVWLENSKGEAYRWDAKNQKLQYSPTWDIAKAHDYPLSNEAERGTKLGPKSVPDSYLQDLLSQFKGDQLTYDTGVNSQLYQSPLSASPETSEVVPPSNKPNISEAPSPMDTEGVMKFLTGDKQHFQSSIDKYRKQAGGQTAPKRTGLYNNLLRGKLFG